MFFFHSQLGDIFTIVAAGKKMTFVMDHRDYHHYFTTTQTDFQAAVQPFTKGAGEYTAVMLSSIIQIRRLHKNCMIP